MTAFDNARLVEVRGNAVLVPFLKQRAHDGQLVMTLKGTLARHIQETMGDVFFNTDAETIWSVEIKCEEADKYGNLFLETWSNKNLGSKRAHAEHGSNPGWLLKLRADVLFYYFLDSDELYIISLFKLQHWAFVHTDGKPRIDEYPERLQSKRTQANDTWGRCVPIDVIRREVGFVKVFPRQIELFPDKEAA